jgi:raffinose/stachyose/melibiose transport system permease protein
METTFHRSAPPSKRSATTFNFGIFAMRGVGTLIVLFWSVLVIIPLIVLLSVALKSPVDLLNNPMGWPAQFVWSNFAEA